MNPKLLFFGLIIVAVILEIAADIMFKKWAIDNKSYVLAVGLFVYCIGTILWAFSLRYEHLSTAISIFTIVNLIVIVLVGMLYFKEDLSLINKIGIGVGVLAVILLEL